MARLLLSEGYAVVGITRDLDKARAQIGDDLAEQLTVAAFDLSDPTAFQRCIEWHRPAEVYNFGALSSGARMFENPIAIGETNGVAVTRWLEAIRVVDPSIRFCQASSSELFGETNESPQTEGTPFRPRSPYGAAKLYAHNMLGLYRKHHGIHACSAILFNHESPRRGTEFVTRKVTSAAAAIALGGSEKLVLGDTMARRDWGFAGDYVRAMWLMAQQHSADDYVIATGITHSIHDLCQIAFAHVGLDFREHVRPDPSTARPPESIQLTGDSRKARERLNWHPKTAFKPMIEAMVEADLERLRTNRQLKEL